MKLKSLIISAALLFLFCFNSFAQKEKAKPAGWTAVYAHDENGTPTSGNIKQLLEGLRKGYSVKVGWSWTRQIADSSLTLEHFAEPIFVTIIQQKNVSVIIEPHPLLKSYISISQQEFDNPANIWQCVLTTTGSFNAMVYSRATGEAVKNWPQKHKMVWYLEYP
jgi:hypothetical protein